MVRTPPVGQGTFQPSSGSERVKEASPEQRALADKVKQASSGKIAAPFPTFQRNAPPLAGAVTALSSSIPGRLKPEFEKKAPDSKKGLLITKTATGKLPLIKSK